MRNIGLYVFVTLYCATVLIVLYLGPSFPSVAWLLGACVLTLACARFVGGSFRRTVLFVLMGVVVGIIRLAFVSSDMPLAFKEMLGRSIALTGVIVTIPDVREVNEKLTVEIRSENGESTRVLVTAPLYPSFHAGEVVRISGTLQKPKPFGTDGGRTFAYDRYLRKEGIYAVMPMARIEDIGTSGSIWLRFLRALEAFKNELAQILSMTLPEPESALAIGILVGGKQGLGSRLIEDFTAAGMLQIIVLSGFNVMIVANALMRLLVSAPKKLAFVLATASIMSFVLMAGAGSSAVRAGLMAGLALAARTFRRARDIPRIVCITLFLIVFWNPLALAYDPGLQFSFTATLGLIIGAPVIAARLLFLKRTWLIELFATTLAAEIALLPLLLYETGNLSFVSVLANVLSMPAVPLAMGASALAAVVALPLSHFSPTLPLVIGLPAYVPLAYVVKVATLSASLPFANRILAAFPLWLVLVSYVALAVLAYRLSRPLHLRSASLPRPNSNYRRTRLHTTSSPKEGSRPYTHAPTDQAPA